MTTVARVALPGPSNRFDYTSLDPARAGSTSRTWTRQLLVFDTRTARVLETIHVAGVHGVLAVPQLGRVFASATNDHEALTIDARTDRVVARRRQAYPDGSPTTPSSGTSSSPTRAAASRPSSTPRPPHRDDPARRRGRQRPVRRVASHVLVDVQTRDDIAVIDPRSNRIIRRVSMPGCDHDHGLLVDAPRRLAFVACDGNATLLTLDLRTMKVTGSAQVGGEPGRARVRRLAPPALRLGRERRRRRLRRGARSLAKLGQAFLAPEAHTVAVDPRTHLVYFPLQQGSRAPAAADHDAALSRLDANLGRPALREDVHGACGDEENRDRGGIDSAAINALAGRVSGIASVGLNAIELVSDT